jgi:hypothetical protein
MTEPKKLQEVEKSIPIAEVSNSAYLSAAKGEANSWTVTTKAGASSGDTFTISRNASGEISHTCTTTGKGGCPASGSW